VVEDYSIFDDLGLEIWTVGRCYGYPRVSRLYELHGEEIYIGYRRHLEEAIARGVEVWMRYPIQGARLFPGPEVHRLGGYCTCTISWMLGHALYEGVSRVVLAGAPLSGGHEYARQRPSVLYWIGILRGNGILVEDRDKIVDWGAWY
jgi:hypothetical protein